MKRTILLLSILLGLLASALAQKIRFESSFEKAKSLALEQQKPLAILVTIDPPVPTPNFFNGLNDQAVIEKFNSSFINYKVSREDTAASRRIISDYNIFRFPSMLFLDAKGGVMFSDIAILSMPRPLLQLADRALQASGEKSLVDYDSEYLKGNITTAFLKAYILKRQAAGIVNNIYLIEKYVTGLAVNDLNNYDEVLFILKAGPLLDSNAYRLANINRKVIDSIFKTEPLAARMAINNTIISNTLNKAITDKNQARATAVANFTRNSWSTNYLEGQKNWYLKMLQYYQGVKDTTQYLQMAVTFYDRYYMNVTLDSIKRRDSLDFEAAKNRARQAAPQTKDSSMARTFSFMYPKDDRFATDLNNAAWYFYQAAGNDNNYLLKAMLWSKRAIELSPKPTFYDTYAHLLYRLQFYNEAESMQQKSIELARAQKTNAQAYEETYKKIKTRSL